MMFLLGLRLVLRTGKESLARLVLIASAVAIGVALLLVVLADFHGFQAANNKRCWECTTGPYLITGAIKPAANVELWNYSEDYFGGQLIKGLEVAALGPHAPTPPGIPRLPGAGSYFASPALVTLLKSVPRDELGARFPGSLAGLVGPAALSGPDDLVIIIGRSAAELERLPATERVDAIATTPRVSASENLYQYGFGMVAVGLIFPLLTLIGTATRLAAARREERFAAFRLVGATPRQVGVIASVDAFVGAAVGSLVGIVIFQPLQPAVARVAITGSRYFPSTVAPTTGEYVAVLVGVPIAAICAAVWSLQRVRISPLGASRKTTPSPPSALRIVPLVLGLVVFTAAPFLLGAHKQAGGPLGQSNSGPSPLLLPVLLLGELLIMTGLFLSGSWLTMQGARFVARTARGASGLLAARRLADSPKTAFRSVGGLVLAVFVGTAIAGVVPAVNSGLRLTHGGKLNNVLRVSFTSPYGYGSGPGNGLLPQPSAEMLRRVRSYPGTSTLPVYLYGPQNGYPSCEGLYNCAPSIGILNCHDIGRPFLFIARCPPHAAAIQVQFNLLLITNDLLFTSLPLSTSPIPAEARKSLRSLHMGEVLVTTRNPSTLEKIRTLMAAYTAAAGSSNVPETFGEGSRTRAALYLEIETIALAVTAVTLVIAGCSVAVSVGGGLMERKRPFTLLRVTGAQLRVLYRVVLFESVLPLTLTAAVAAAAGLGTAASILRLLGPKAGSVTLPGHVYFLTLGCALAASLAVLLATLPLLKRITTPDEVRFE
ncbi:MAG TPA: FtsX-like permease family protein [Streptosporangiaceae bacterium]|nr:FtsX-like permease family protein [Streptosporangiaceae bacterium]